MQHYNDAGSQYNKFGGHKQRLHRESMSVTGQKDNNYMDSEGINSEYKSNGFEMNI